MILYFAHANGFPSKAYDELFSYLSPNYQITFLETIGSDPNYPITNNWHFLVDEIISDLQKLQEPVWAFGHSLGGVLLFLARQKHPQLFKGLILLDSPIMNRYKSYVIKFAKLTNLIEKYSPAARTLGRKTQWKNTEDAYTHFRKKEMFKDFTEKSLLNYVNFGTIDFNGGRKLLFNPDIEYQIYMTLPDNLFKNKLSHHLPSLLIYATNTYAVSKRDRDFMEKSLGFKLDEIEGSHLFPFENPGILATKIMSFINNNT